MEIAGKTILLAVGADPTAAPSADTYTDVGGGTAISWDLNDSDVETTNQSTNSFRTLLKGAGTISLDATIDGIYSDDAGITAALAAHEAQLSATSGATAATSFHNWRITVPGYGTYTGKFKMGNVNLNAGLIDDALKFSIPLMSSGAFVFVAS